jgi:hypothetical protein
MRKWHSELSLMNKPFVFHKHAVPDYIRIAQVALELVADIVVPHHEVYVLLTPRLLCQHLKLLLECLPLLVADGRAFPSLWVYWVHPNVSKDCVDHLLVQH